MSVPTASLLLCAGSVTASRMGPAPQTAQGDTTARRGLRERPLDSRRAGALQDGPHAQGTDESPWAALVLVAGVGRGHALAVSSARVWPQGRHTPR